VERWSWCPLWFCFPVFGEGKKDTLLAGMHS
jgi:hypothetical protein